MREEAFALQLPASVIVPAMREGDVAAGFDSHIASKVSTSAGLISPVSTCSLMVSRRVREDLERGSPGFMSARDLHVYLISRQRQRERHVPEVTVSRPKDATGFVVLPRRWVVERTLAWLMRARRHARDYDTAHPAL